MSMAAPLWRLVCQTKSNRIQAVAQELVKISLFYIYMNRYLHIKVFSFVPKVDLTFRIGHMSENISYYGLLQPIRYKPKYNANIRIRIGFWVANIRIQFLAPSAERQRSFSNADSSVVVVRRRRPSSTFQLKA